MQIETEIRCKKRRNVKNSEPENIHQLMYEMATKNAQTTIQLNPIGGSKSSKEDQKMSTDDWRYSDERMDVRTQGLNILLNKFDVKYVQMDRQGIPIRVFTNAFMIGFLRVIIELMVSLHTTKHITR